MNAFLLVLNACCAAWLIYSGYLWALPISIAGALIALFGMAGEY